MTTTQVVETSVTVNNSPIQNYAHLDDHASTTIWNDPYDKNLVKGLNPASMFYSVKEVVRGVENEQRTFFSLQYYEMSYKYLDPT